MGPMNINKPQKNIKITPAAFGVNKDIDDIMARKIMAFIELMVTLLLIRLSFMRCIPAVIFDVRVFKHTLYLHHFFG